MLFNFYFLKGFSHLSILVHIVKLIQTDTHHQTVVKWDPDLSCVAQIFALGVSQVKDVHDVSVVEQVDNPDPSSMCIHFSFVVVKLIVEYQVDQVIDQLLPHQGAENSVGGLLR